MPLGGGHNGLESKRSISMRLGAGLLLALTALGVYSGYTIAELRVLRRLQTGVIDRNRRDSLLLVRIQNSLNMLGLAMRDMLDEKDGYPLTAWRAQFQRLRTDLEDAVAREAEVAPAARTPDLTSQLQSSMAQFWDAVDRMFDHAAHSEADARTEVRLSLQARQAALSTAVSRLLVQNHDSDEQALARTHQIHDEVERNLYLFLAATVLFLAAVSVYLIHYNRRVFDRVSALSDLRSELAQQLISMQENTFRSISRELHDEFGQILTAVGTMLQRSARLASSDPAAMRAELREVHQVVQATLEKVRTLSQALHPVVLEEVGVESAIDAYIPVFERRTGIVVHCVRTPGPWTIGREQSIHLYRVLQEALNNVARHAGVREVQVRLTFAGQHLILEVEDNGPGFGSRQSHGLGLVSMRERAEIAGGRIEFLAGAAGGALVRFSVPASTEEAHARSEA
ncbi:MAG: sensor histidine kinase [Acidobacteriota bacterium]|nr:sensor histidine kinase [Acidobacteriota bacterium]